MVLPISMAFQQQQRRRQQFDSITPQDAQHIITTLRHASLQDVEQILRHAGQEVLVHKTTTMTNGLPPAMNATNQVWNEATNGFSPARNTTNQVRNEKETKRERAEQVNNSAVVLSSWGNGMEQQNNSSRTAFPNAQIGTIFEYGHTAKASDNDCIIATVSTSEPSTTTTSFASSINTAEKRSKVWDEEEAKRVGSQQEAKSPSTWMPIWGDGSQDGMALTNQRNQQTIHWAKTKANVGDADDSTAVSTSAQSIEITTLSRGRRMTMQVPGAFAVNSDGTEAVSSRSVSSTIVGSSLHSRSVTSPIWSAQESQMHRMTSEEYLVRAEMVNEQLLAVAKADSWCRRHQWWLTGGAVIVVGMIIGAIVLAVVDFGSVSSPGATMAPTTIEQGLYSGLSAMIVTDLSTSVKALNDEATPQYMALQWITNLQIASVEEPIASHRLLQLYSLAVLFYSTAGETAWLKSGGWLTEADECTWYGVRCTVEGSLSALLLSGNNLNGTLPLEIALLSNHLSILDVADNSLAGPIPQEYERLAILSRLTLRGNMLSSTIPSELFADLRKLVYLDLSDNSLTSTIPNKIEYLTMLQQLYLGSNNLIGDFPSGIGQLTELLQMGVENNRLSSPLPSELGQLTSLETLQAMNNSLLGPIPSEIALLGSLESFNLSQNFVFASIPSSIGSMSKLTALDLTNNLLTGAVPASLYQLWHLKSLRLGSNFLRSFRQIYLFSPRPFHTNATFLATNPPSNLEPILPTFGAMSNSLLELDLSHNFFQGAPLPLDFASLEKLTSLNLGHSGLAFWDEAFELAIMPDLEFLDLSGLDLRKGLPVNVSQFTSLKELHIHSSELTGSIPFDLSLLTNLRVADLSQNWLMGALPSNQLQNLAKLSNLDLRDNMFSGTISANFGFLTNLSVLNLRHNTLSGPLPTEISLLRSLEVLDVNGNIMSGDWLARVLPASNQLENLTKLSHLDLGDNAFSGIITTTIGLLTDLSVLNLRRNGLSGPIPTEIGLLRSLEVLDISFNYLSGTVPTELGMAKKLKMLAISSPELVGEIPSHIGQLEKLESLSLRSTYLTGGLPSELGLLRNLRYLSLASHGITGPVPKEFENMTALREVEVFQTSITGQIPSKMCEFLVTIELNCQSNATCACCSASTFLGLPCQ